MGLLGLIKVIKEEKKKGERFLKMNVEELVTLSDDDFMDAIRTRILAEDSGEVSECLKEFHGAKRVFYVVDYFGMEIQNGGLSQFFENSSRELSLYVADCLDTIGAFEYEKCFRDFMGKYGVEEKEEQTEKSVFDEFDEIYSELDEKEPLETILLKYARENLQDFV